MQLSNDNKIIGEPLHSFYEEKTFVHPKRLIEKNYATRFNVLKNWYLVRTFAIKTYKLTYCFIYHIEKDQFDEN